MTIEDASAAVCPICRCRNDMPPECLRDHWEDMECDRCGASLEYRGVHVSKSWEYEVHTRIGVEPDKSLSPAQRAMLIASHPDDLTGREGSGVELTTGAAYAVAKALERKGYGYREGPGGSLPGMYWSNLRGLEMRAALSSSLDKRAWR